MEGAEQISIAVAFLKEGGARIIGLLLEARLKQGAKIEAFLGTDFYITEPKALAHLLAIKKRFGAFEMFLANGKTATFHPKSYVGRSEGQVRCLIGSANLTTGALTTNDEISILATVNSDEQLSSDLKVTFADFRESGSFQELDDLVLGQYASRHKDAERLRRKLEKELEDNFAAQFDLRRLNGFLRQYRADKTERSALAKRRTDRDKALKVQQLIADLGNAPRISKEMRSVFAENLSNLISSREPYQHLWHSGDIHRRGSAALDHPKKTITLFAAGRKAAKLAPERGYEQMRQLALGIPGVGVNMITAILCTFAPKRYAVFNGNTSGALAAIGIGAPRSPTVATLSAERYTQLCATIDALRRRIGGADFTDADAFLNWLYFKTKPSKRAHEGGAPKTSPCVSRPRQVVRQHRASNRPFRQSLPSPKAGSPFE
ncbi:MAG: hypothetical protein E5V72_01745 [Mesorhizobium sp.]|nr:MAG: hypothetical protein E5V72_01745 [Mesorhizobium sp.]